MTGIKTLWDYPRYILTGLRKNDIPEEYIDYIIEQIIANNPELRASKGAANP
jgi:hypothetical protein